MKLLKPSGRQLVLWGILLASLGGGIAWGAEFVRWQGVGMGLLGLGGGLIIVGWVLWISEGG